MTAEIDWSLISRPEPTMPKRIPLNSLVAASKRLTNAEAKRKGWSSDGKKAKSAAWQRDAWDLYRLVGEERFLVTTLAGRVGAALLYAGKLPKDPTEKPEPVEDNHPAHKILEAFGETPSARGQILARMSISLQIPGDGWIVGIPKDMLDPESGMKPEDFDALDGSVDIEDLVWKMLSCTEVKIKDGEVTLSVEGRKIVTEAESVWMVRVWNPDPERFEQADSPARSSLPVLRELVGLTMHVSAQLDSRLAGAGVFLVPKEAKDAVMASMPEDYEGDDPFTDALMEAMMTAIADRSNASALVPLVFCVPGEFIEMFKFVTFSTPLDAEARNLREEAIRRLALGQDIPPEVLLGVGGMNHWGAWLVREDTISTHVEPQLQTICDALTVQYLWPVLEAQGMSEDEYQQYVIWYDVDHLITRPNRLQDAVLLHQEGAISDAALRDAGGFADSDAAVDVQTSSAAAGVALKMVQANASLIRNPGIPALVQAIQQLLDGKTPKTQAPEGTGPIQPQPPQTTEIVNTTNNQTLPAAQDNSAVASGYHQMTLEDFLTASQAYRSKDPSEIVVNVTVEPPEMNFRVQTDAPVINVEPTPITVENHVEPTPVTVENHVDGPTVNVEPTPVSVEAPSVTVESPTVSVEAPSVTVENKIPEAKPPVVNVNAAKPTRRRSKVIRDAKGQITEVETTE